MNFLNDICNKTLIIADDELKSKILDYLNTIDKFVNIKIINIEEFLRHYFFSYDEQTIYIDKDLHIEQKRQTLMHELMHCYIGNYLYSTKEYTEEDLWNISANSHDIIHKIVEDYFK